MQLLLSSNSLACKQSPDICISHPVRHTDCRKQVLKAQATVNCAFSRAEPGQINLKQLLNSLRWNKTNHCKHTEKMYNCWTSEFLQLPGNLGNRDSSWDWVLSGCTPHLRSLHGTIKFLSPVFQTKGFQATRGLGGKIQYKREFLKF